MDFTTGVVLLVLSWNLMVLSYLIVPRRKPKVTVVMDVTITENGPEASPTEAHPELPPPPPEETP